MKTGVVRLSDIAAEPGQPLNVNFWLNRREGEGYPAYLARQKTVKSLTTARNELAQALAHLDEQIKNLSDPES